MYSDHDMTSHPLSPSLTQIPEVMQYLGRMFWDVARHCETLWDAMWCCVVLWDIVWFCECEAPEFTHHYTCLYGSCMFMWYTMSRTLTGYLSPSLGLKFSDVPGGLAAISKVPALSLENRQNLQQWQLQWQIWHVTTCCNTPFHVVPWSLTSLQFVAESWWDATCNWMYWDMLQCIQLLQHEHLRAPPYMFHALAKPAMIAMISSWGAWLVPDPVVHWLDWGIWILLWKVWFGLHEGCHHVWNSGRLWRWISYLPGQGLWPRGEKIQVECRTCKRTSGNDGHYWYVLSRWCCAQRVACSWPVLCMLKACFKSHVIWLSLSFRHFQDNLQRF